MQVTPTTAPDDGALNEALVLHRTREWLEKAVIGLNLCPFAKAVHVRGQIRWVVTTARSADELQPVLHEELRHLATASPADVDTTLLIHPLALNDFLDFNNFLDVADATVEELGLDGVLQVASFHPDYQFADAGPDDITNYTNRTPYPTLHLLREDSIARAVEAYPDAEAIYGRNMETLRGLGLTGWLALFDHPQHG